MKIPIKKYFLKRKTKFYCIEERTDSIQNPSAPHLVAFSHLVDIPH